MKRLSLAIALFTSAALLSGCIIVPPRHGGHRGDHHHRYSNYNDAGPAHAHQHQPRGRR